MAASIKEVRDRIGSVSNTKKITEAMKLVAAAKVRRAQEAVVNGRPFAENLVKVGAAQCGCTGWGRRRAPAAVRSRCSVLTSCAARAARRHGSNTLRTKYRPCVSTAWARAWLGPAAVQQLSSRSKKWSCGSKN
mgnify:CR=1 FL=1